MLRFRQYLLEAGQAAGTLELAKMSLAAARAYANKQFEQYQHTSLDTALPDFDKNFLYAQKLARLGFAQRKDMPVIDQKDVHDLQQRLKGGFLDINAPHAPDISDSNPFPQGLKGDDAKRWLSDGLPVHDRAKATDDCVSVTERKIPCGELRPIQKQIYFDKCIDNTAKGGVNSAIVFLQSNYLIVSSDKYIIDGHHRWMSSVLINPQMALTCIAINLPIDKLLPLTLAYSDAVGNVRNQ